MKILVTGGTGYIGSHTCVELLAAGHEVTVVDNLSNSDASVLDRIALIASRRPDFQEMDIRDEAGIDRLFAASAFDAIVHFAGLKVVSESIEKPALYHDNNVGGSKVLFEAAARHAIANILFSSSANVYGTAASSPLREGTPTAPENPYGLSKLLIEGLLREFWEADHTRSAVALRYFNPVGAHASGQIGEVPRGTPTNLMPYICRVAAGSLPELTIFGRDYPTPDRTAIRDYIHVVDLARGHLKALEHVRNVRGMHIVNLGTGQGTSVIQMVAAFERVNGVRVPHRFGARRAGDSGEAYADVSLAAERLGWRSRLTLDDMCRDAWRWQQRNSNAVS